MSIFAKIAIVLLAVFVFLTPLGVGLLVGYFTSILGGVGAGLGTLGLCSAIASKWIGDE